MKSITQKAKLLIFQDHIFNGLDDHKLDLHNSQSVWPTLHKSNSSIPNRWNPPTRKEEFAVQIKAKRQEPPRLTHSHSDAFARVLALQQTPTTSREIDRSREKEMASSISMKNPTLPISDSSRSGDESLFKGSAMTKRGAYAAIFYMICAGISLSFSLSISIHLKIWTLGFFSGLNLDSTRLCFCWIRVFRCEIEKKDFYFGGDWFWGM